ncbi:unnamed protein product [Lathyrus sativus]|nr:unnamed protein product [Lathyrus sativus]
MCGSKPTNGIFFLGPHPIRTYWPFVCCNFRHLLAADLLASNFTSLTKEELVFSTTLRSVRFLLQSV